jgi:protein SERAC1
MAELYRIGGTDGADRLGDVVCVHGLHGDWQRTWTTSDKRWDLPWSPKKDSAFWPGWLVEDSPQLAVWSVGYDAAASEWWGDAMPLKDWAANLRDALVLHEFGMRPLVFVAHSLGGLIVKRLLRDVPTSMAP